MHQPDSERAATERAVEKLTDELTGVEVIVPLYYAQFPKRYVLMTASSLADRARQVVSWGLDRVRSQPSRSGNHEEEYDGRSDFGRSRPLGRLHGA
jgi:hypothetical protein